MAEGDKRTFSKRLREFAGVKGSWVLAALALLILLAYFFEPYRPWYYAGMALLCGAVVLGIAATNKRLFFNERDMTVRTKILGIKQKDTTYGYDDIYRFIMGKNYGFNPLDRYALYIDRNDEITKIIGVRDYKRCIALMRSIQDKAGKLIYDGTGEGFLSEDDLFRDYYRLKTMVYEVGKKDEGNAKGGAGEPSGVEE
jgi:hypothetical protein